MSAYILLVEDEAVIAMAEAKMLESQGYKVLTAGSGEKAVECAVADRDIDLILMDIDLGRGIDGTEAARRILSERTLPIVFLTGHAEKEMVEKVKGITRYGYVLKNSGEFVLIESIRMALQLFEAHEGLEEENREREKTAAVLRERNEFIETILDNLPIGLAVNYIDQGSATYMNRKFEEIYGWPKEILLDIGSFFDTVYPDPAYREDLKTRIMEDMASGDPERMIWENIGIQTMSGEKRIISAKNIPIDSQNFMISTVSDVTKNMEIVEQLRRSEEQLRITLDSIGDAVIATDTDGSVVRMNPIAEKLCGWDLHSAFGKPLEQVFCIINANTRQTVENPVARVLETGKIVGLANHTVLVSRDGTEFQIADSAAPIVGESGSIIGTVLVFRDVTQEYARERELEESEKKYRELFYYSPIGIFQTTSKGQALHVNPRMAELVGAASPDEALANFRDLSADLYTSRERRKEFLALLKERGQVEGFEYEALRLDGEHRWLSMNARIHGGHNGGDFLIDGFTSDITERKRAEEALKANEEKYRLIVQTNMDGYWLLGTDGSIRDVNEAYCRMSGYTREELLRMKISDLEGNENTGEVAEHMRKVLEKGTDRFESVHRRKDGSLYDVEVSTNFSRLGDDFLVAYLRDISERKKATEELRQALKEKQFLLKEINHRVKNNLAMIISLINMKNSVLPDAVDLSDIVNQIDAIRLVHEKLGQTETGTYISARGYIPDLLNTVFSSFYGGTVDIAVEVEDLELQTGTVISLGLMINEIATNAIKHGFDSVENPRFRVELNRQEEGGYLLRLSNNGSPIPDEIDFTAPGTLGLQLIGALAAQLDGSLEIDRAPHPRFTVLFSSDGP
jgi:PAS domain S-box-containing protein